MVEDQFIENNTVHFEATGSLEEDFAISVRSSSATIRGNKITCKGAASGMQLISGPPTHVINNIIIVESQAMCGLLTDAGYGVITGNTITGGKIGYSSRSGAVLFENNTITGSHWGFFSKGFEEVKNNTITNCTGHGMVLAGLRGPISGNTITNNDSTGIWVLSSVDLGGGINNGIGKNIIRDNGYYDMRISINAVTPDTLFINNNVWDHETISDILKYDILNESTGGKLLLDFNSIIAKPFAVQLFSPVNQSFLTSRPAQLVWQTLENADTYQVQVSADEFFTTLLFDSLLTDVAFLIEDLPNQTDYYWRVRAVNLAGEGEWSTSRKFSTLITGLQETVIGKNEIVLYPNPTKGKFSARLNDTVGQVQCSQLRVEWIEVVDLNGRVLENVKLLTENDSPEFDISHLEPGIYFCRIKTSNSVFVSKLILK
jgi:hypothetical protein